MERKVATRGLEENSPGHSFSKDCTQGLLSVRIQAGVFDGMMQGLKCFVAAVMDKAFILQGSHVT